MPLLYPEGGIPGMLLQQKPQIRPRAIDTFKVQLVPLRTAPKARIGNPEAAVRLLREMEDYDRESAKIIHLDTKNQVTGVETISVGSLSASIVHPRETVKGAILNNSANVIFLHNHPSGICGPSNEDVEITNKLEKAFELVGIKMLDSIIIGKGCYYSLKELGYLGTKVETTAGMVSEPRANQETAGKVEFISAMNDYISAGADLAWRDRAAQKLKASRYFNPWFNEFFYEHDLVRAKQNLMKFFIANEQGLGVVNHAYYGVISEYLRAISKPAAGIYVRESTGAGAGRPCERIKEIKAELEKVSKSLAEAYRVRDNIRIQKFVETGKKLRAEWDSLVGECQKKQWEQMKGMAAVRETRNPGIDKLVLRENIVPLIPHLKQEIKAIHALATKNDPAAETRAHHAMKQIDSGINAKTITQEQAKTLKDAVGKALYKWPYIEIAKLLGEKEIVTEEPVVLKTEKLGTMYLTYVQLRKEVYSEWGNTPEEAVKNAINKAETQIRLGNHTVSENIQNNIEIFLNRLTMDTSRYSRTNPIPVSAVIGAANPEDGGLAAYHITDRPEETIRKLRSNIPLCQMNPEGDIGCGFYASGVPQYWSGRSRAKWDFARNLTGAQRQKLVDVILQDPRYKKGGGYLADFEVDYLNRDLKQFVETGDVNLLAMTGNQPYNVRVAEEIARKAGVPSPKVPGMVKVKLQGRFINAESLYYNPEILNRARAWAVINRPKLLEWKNPASNQNLVNAWLFSMGYSGAFTKSGFSTNPEMVIWDRRAIIDAWIPEPQG